jgi:hypothetical protein
MGRQWTRWQAALTKAEGAAGNLARRVETWLKRFEGPDEEMLRALVGTKELVVVYPAGMKESAARRMWTSYLRRQRGKHGVWVVVNGVLIPPTIVMAVLPGPNVIGFWCAYRAACHALAVGATGRWLKDRGTTVFEADEALNARVNADGNKAAVEALEGRCGWKGFRAFLERLPRRGREVGGEEGGGRGASATGSSPRIET